MRVDVGREGEHCTLTVPDPSIAVVASVAADASFREGADAGLKQLVGREAKEIGDAVQVLQLDLAFAAEKLTNPHFAVATPGRELALLMSARPQQGRDVLREQAVGTHFHSDKRL